MFDNPMSGALGYFGLDRSGSSRGESPATKAAIDGLKPVKRCLGKAKALEFKDKGAFFHEKFILIMLSI